MLVAALLYLSAKISSKSNRIGDVITISPNAKGRVFSLARRSFFRFRRSILQEDNFNRTRYEISGNVYDQFAVRSDFAFEFGG